MFGERTYQEAAQKIGVSMAAWRGLEDGIFPPTPAELIAMNTGGQQCSLVPSAWSCSGWSERLFGQLPVVFRLHPKDQAPSPLSLPTWTPEHACPRTRAKSKNRGVDRQARRLELPRCPGGSPQEFELAG